MNTNSKFYLGRLYDPLTGQVTDQPLLYDPADMTTHAVVVGMTGSGKTGLCLDLLEEAALQHIPALMIDPKGISPTPCCTFPTCYRRIFSPG
jgi:DNA helicase HerA-like ATPase